MKKIDICINSQTPLIRFKLHYTELVEKYGDLPDPVPLGMLIEGEDYEMSPGGVTKIVYPLVHRMIEKNLVSNAHWVSLNPIGPERVKAGKILVHNISLEHPELPAYAHMKERIWEEVHDLERHKVGPEEFFAYAKYNWLSATKMLELPVDVYYVHDFQQLQTGNMIGLAAPTVFRWHIPLILDRVNPYMRNFIVKCMEAFDAVIVSSRRDLEGLIRAGYHGKAYQLYPCIDERKWTRASSSEVGKFCSTFNVAPDDKVILVVGRMDGIKGQDLVIKAVAQLLRKIPNLKLVLVGDGSFSGAARGGLSHPKANLWRNHLEKLTRKLKLEKRVVFTGFLPDNLLQAAYQRADVVVLPSRKEGFGLVVPEAWLYKKPVVVSRGAGVSETILEGINGYIFKPNDVGGLAQKLMRLLKNPKRAGAMGERGKETVKTLSMEKGIRKISAVFNEVIGGFRKA